MIDLKDIEIIHKLPELLEDGEDPRDAWKNAKGFNLVSLGAWIDLANELGIPHVPAVRIAEIALDDLFEECETEVNRFYASIAQAERPRHMVRWDCCSPLEVKANISAGDIGWKDAYGRIELYEEPRTADVLYEYPDSVISVWQRPWVDIAQYEGWPIEYRVFVHDGKIIGVSNYYPQRALPDMEDWVMRDILRCRELTEYLIDGLNDRIPDTDILRYPGGPHGQWPVDRVSFSADFIRTENDRSGCGITYLEGGPPWGAGRMRRDLIWSRGRSA